jgi:hypothetical protein
MMVSSVRLIVHYHAVFLSAGILPARQDRRRSICRRADHFINAQMRAIHGQVQYADSTPGNQAFLPNLGIPPETTRIPAIIVVPTAAISRLIYGGQRGNGADVSS